MKIRGKDSRHCWELNMCLLLRTHCLPHKIGTVIAIVPLQMGKLRLEEVHDCSSL